MPSTNNFEIISKASPHTIKKFELIDAYVEAWAHKLLEFGKNTGKCKGIVFIDCMCNSGMYVDEEGNNVVGTPIRVANTIAAIMREAPYQHQQAFLYFNDIDSAKINELKKHLPANTRNFHIVTSVGDGNNLLHKIGSNLYQHQTMSYLLVYDPYTASIDWTALLPFIKNWGEVIINHMVSDSIRAVSQVKRPEAISKYEQTYLTNIEELLSFGSDRIAYEKRAEEIIKVLRGSSRYYIASYPFFNTRNSLIYDLIHCTNSIEGFKLYKSTAWKTFGNKSSLKKLHNNPDQLSLNFGDDYSSETEPFSNENCYYVQDIVKFILKTFSGKTDVPLIDIWRVIDEHPIFPSDLFKKEIKNQLKEHGCKVHKSTIDFI